MRELKDYEIENFITHALLAFKDSYPGLHPEMSNIFMVLLSDTIKINSEKFEDIIKNFNSYKELTEFTRKFWDSFMETNEIYGTKYNIIKKGDFGFNIAHNLFIPVRDGSYDTYGTSSTDGMMPFKRVLLVLKEHALVEVE